VVASGAAQSNYKVLYKFTGGANGDDPRCRRDLRRSRESLWHDPQRRAYDFGTVFKLTTNSDGSWKEVVLCAFCSLTNCVDGAHPGASLIFDAAGNLYGTTQYGGGYGRGTSVVDVLAPVRP